MAQTVKNLPARGETQVPSLGQEDSLEKEMTIHSSILAWGNPMDQEPGRLQSMGWQIDGETMETVTDFILGGRWLTAVMKHSRW